MRSQFLLLLFFFKVVGILNVNDNLHHVLVEFSCGVHQQKMMGFGCVSCNWVFLGFCEMYVGCCRGLKLVLHWVELLKKLVEFKALQVIGFCKTFLWTLVVIISFLFQGFHMLDCNSLVKNYNFYIGFYDQV